MTRARRQRVPKVLRAGPETEPAPGMRMVTVNTTGDGFISIEAWVFGEWAAHRRIGGQTRIWDVTYLPAGMNISGSDGPPNPDPLCEICRAHPATLGCQFELRGAKVGKVCGKRLCKKCAATAAGPIRVCPPHAAFLKREAGK